MVTTWGIRRAFSIYSPGNDSSGKHTNKQKRIMKKLTKSFGIFALFTSLFLISCEKEKIVGIDNITGVKACSVEFPDSVMDEIKFDGKMLVIENPQALYFVYKMLSEANCIDGDSTGVEVLVKFENHFHGFQSLRARAQKEMDDLIKTNSLTIENNPDTKCIGDYTMRTLLNESGEIMLGGKTVNILEEINKGESEEDGARGQCCWMYREKLNNIYNGNGTKMIECRSWVYNIPIPIFWFGVHGSSTRSYHLQSANGTTYSMLPSNVEKIGTSSTYTFYEITCSGAGPNNDYFYKQNLNSSFVQKSKAEWTITVPYFISAAMVDHYADYYTGSDIFTTLDFCN
jgi:hypothetical protein